MRQLLAKIFSIYKTWFGERKDMVFGWLVTLAVLVAAVWITVPDKGGILGLLGFVVLLVFAASIFYWTIILVSRVPYVGKYIVGVLAAIVTVQVYLAIWPSEEFYRQEIRTHTGLDISNSYKVVNRYSSYPDQFGDYTARVLVKYETLEFGSIRDNLNQLEHCHKPPVGFQFTSMEAIRCWGARKIGERMYLLQSEQERLLYFEYSSS